MAEILDGMRIHVVVKTYKDGSKYPIAAFSDEATANSLFIALSKAIPDCVFEVHFCPFNSYDWVMRALMDEIVRITAEREKEKAG